MLVIFFYFFILSNEDNICIGIYVAHYCFRATHNLYQLVARQQKTHRGEEVELEDTNEQLNRVGRMFSYITSRK